MQYDAAKIVKPIDRPHHISLLLPTRGRPEYLDSVFDSVANTVGDADAIDAWIYVDHDDLVTKRYIHAESYHRYPFTVHWVLGERTLSQGRMINVLRQRCTTNPGIYLPCADDYLFKSANWDGAIRAAFDRYPDRIALGYIPNPLSAPEQVSFPVLSAPWTNITGRIFTEYFPFWSDDTWLDHVSQMVRRKVRIEIRAESINEAGKTPRLKNLPFWQSFFTHLMDERLADAKLLLRAIYPQDCPEYRKAIEDAEKLADVITEQRERITTSYLSSLEDKHSSFPENPEPHLMLLHLSLEAKAVGRLFAKTDSLMQAGDFNRAIKMLAAVGLAEQHYKQADSLRTVCLERLESAEAKPQTAVEEYGTGAGHTEGPRFSFVMIVLNGMPFIEYSLKSVYAFAHEIVVVEGAVEQCMFAANPDGSSTDGTVEFLKSFPDPQNKIKLIQGRWPEKCDMQNEALRYVTGDYVWLIDSDEIYKKQDLERVKTLVQSDPFITQINFNGDNFWKGLDYIFVSPRFFESAAHWRRVFKFVRGAKFTTHRPPAMVWPGSELTTEQMQLLDGHTTRQMGIIPCHYSYVLDRQVRQKIELYDRYGWSKDWNIDLHEWYTECFLKWTPENREQIEARYPIWTGDAASHTLPFEGTHPDVIIEYVLKKSFVHGGGAPSSVMQHVIEAIREIKARSEHESILAIETGTIRSYDENHLSTYHISRELGGRGSLISVDISGDSIRKSQNICHGATNIEFAESDSIQYLQHLKDRKFHFAFLDSVNDKDVIFEEFRLLAPMMAESGILMVDDAGITPDGRTFDISVPAQKGHQVWQFLADCGVIPTILTTPGGHGTQLKVVFTKDNIARITERLSLLNSRSGGELSEISAGKSKRARVAADYVRSGTHIETQSSFGAEIRELFAKIRPKKIIETGTYLGTGTTTIIARALEALGIDDATFYTIEVNPQNHARAKEYLAANNLKVHALNGLSVPRSLLPDRDQIARRTITDVDYDGIFADHDEADRVPLYFNETDFPGVGDDLLYTCLKQFDFKPDFVLLDSAGHMGSIEFDYLIENLQGECYIALDDIYHVKHHRSFQQIQKDQRFELVARSNEKFGFCIARFAPEAVRERAEGGYIPDDRTSEKRVLIVRADSIGDFVIFSGALPYYRKIYPNAHVAIVVSQGVGSLAEVCPFIDEVITFDRARMCSQPNYASEFIADVRNKKFDVAICPALSRDKVSEFIAINSGAAEKITCSGDTANLPAAIIEANNAHYTKIVPMSEGIALETSRNEEFLKGLGVELDSPCRPTVWITQADREAAEELLGRRGIENAIVIAPFAQQDTRNWSLENWAKLISLYPDMPVIICGTQKDGPAAERIVSLAEHPNIHNLCGLTTVRHLAALIAGSRLCICSESAAAHLAAAADRPHVVLVGGGHFGRFMPYSPQTRIVHSKMDCYGCNWQCKYGRDIRCIATLSVDAVKRAVDKSLGEPAAVSAFDGRNAAGLHTKNGAGKSPFLVSAIVSTFNSEKFIKGCLEDLENQTMADRLEIIVVNSGSQENEEAIVREYQQKYDNIVYIKTEHREGIYAAWNRAVKIARGTFLTNANTDDRHSEDALAIMAEMLLANPDLALVYGDQICTDTPNGTFVNHHATEMARRPEYSSERLLWGCCVGSQPMWRKSLHDEFGYFDDTLTCAGDWDFWLRISGRYKFKHIPEFLGLYYCNEDGIEHGRKIHSLYERYKVGRRYGNPYISTIPLYKGKDTHLVSVVTPAYNAAEYIAEAIESVLIQSYRNFELIVVDDGSTDDTSDIVSGFKDDKIRCFHRENAGPAGARNLAIKKSSGDFIAFLDADDMMTPEFLSKHLQEFDKHPEAELIYCDDSLIDRNVKPVRVIQRPEYSNRKSLIRDMFRCGFPVVPFRTCIRRSVFDKIGLFDEDLLVGEDYDMMRRFIRYGLKAHHLKDALYLRRMTSDSLSRTHSPQKAQCHFDVVRRFMETFTHDELFPDVPWHEIPPDMRPLHAKCLAVVTYLAIGQDFVKANSPDIYVKIAFGEACSQLNDCLKIDPGNREIRQLLEKCERGRRKYDQGVQPAVATVH
ncbi:MAG: glycosyltransferase [Phycisphaerales bacterium]|nr:MAG: glycosyltransferase [Phycisphaerales bacterium]